MKKYLAYRYIDNRLYYWQSPGRERIDRENATVIDAKDAVRLLIENKRWKLCSLRYTPPEHEDEAEYAAKFAYYENERERDRWERENWGMW
jgi:hypothetical protein